MSIRVEPVLVERRSLAGQTAPRVGLNGWTRETTPGRTNAELPQKVLEEMLAGSRRISKGKTLSEEARTLQQSQTSTTRFSGHHPLLKENRKSSGRTTL
jgi:hypothetical protein